MTSVQRPSRSEAPVRLARLSSPTGPAYRRVRELHALYQDGPPRLRGAAPRVAVVGAGLAGLVAAHLLSLAGCRPAVFEYAQRVGGRVLTDRSELVPGLVTELGGEFIDSTHADMLALTRRFGCTLLDTCTLSEARLHPILHFRGDNRSEDQVAEAFAPHSSRVAADAASLSRRITRASHSATDRRFDGLSIDEYLERLGMETWLRSLISVGYTTLNGLDAGEQSCINFLKQIGPHPTRAELFGASDERWKVVEGLDTLTQGMAAGLVEPVRQGHRLVRMARRGAAIALDFETDGVTRPFVADAVVMAIPFTLLRLVEADGVFSAVKRHAIDQLAYGSNAKLLVATRTRLWRDLGCQGDVSTDGALQTGWDSSRSRPGTEGVFTFFLGGTTGAKIGEGDARDQAQRLITEADTHWPGFASQCTGRVLRVHWPSERFSLASYSTYRTGHRTGLAGDESTPDGSIFFAGEHCSVHAQGYMQGAAASGRRAALALLNRLH